MPLALFRTKSSEGKRGGGVSRTSSRDSIVSLSALQNEHSQLQQQNDSVASMLQQNSQEMDDVLRRLQAVIGVDGDGSNRTAPRASAAAISSLPHAHIMRHNKKDFAHDDSACGVCCERLMDGAALTRLPCGHVYHINCATTWLSKTCTCPECRYELETDDVLFEKKRRARMTERSTVSCQCHKSGMHSCFFADPSKSLLDQLDDDKSSNSSECSDAFHSADFSIASTSTCDGVDPLDDTSDLFYFR
jgi:hypothetical protein